MATIKKNDFVEMDYSGRIKEGSMLFDTTEEKVAKENGMYDKDAEYSPVVICLGENSMLKGLEDQIIGKETEKEYTFEIDADNAFGRKDAKLIQMIPASKFRQQNIQPMPGLQLNIDGVFGIVKTVSGGRCLVDFNHPLAGKDLIYKVKINKVVDDDKEKLKSLLKLHLHIKDAEIEIKENAASLRLEHSMPKQAQEEFITITERLIPSIKKVDFEAKEAKN